MLNGRGRGGGAGSGPSIELFTGSTARTRGLRTVCQPSHGLAGRTRAAAASCRASTTSRPSTTGCANGRGLITNPYEWPTARAPNRGPLRDWGDAKPHGRDQAGRWVLATLVSAGYERQRWSSHWLRAPSIRRPPGFRERDDDSTLAVGASEGHVPPRTTPESVSRRHRAFPSRPAWRARTAGRRGVRAAVLLGGMVIAATEGDSVTQCPPPMDTSCGTRTREDGTELGRCPLCGEHRTLCITSTMAYDPATGSLFALARDRGRPAIARRARPAYGRGAGKRYAETDVRQYPGIRSSRSVPDVESDEYK